MMKLDTCLLNKEILSLEPHAKRAKIYTLSHLKKQINLLLKKQNKPGAKSDKWNRKLGRLNREIQFIKILTPTEISKFSLVNKLSFAAVISKDDAPIEQRALCRLVESKGYPEKVGEFRAKYGDYEKEVPQLIKVLGLNSRKKNLKKWKQKGEYEKHIFQEQRLLKLLHDFGGLDFSHASHLKLTKKKTPSDAKADELVKMEPMEPELEFTQDGTMEKEEDCEGEPSMSDSEGSVSQSDVSFSGDKNLECFDHEAKKSLVSHDVCEVTCSGGDNVKVKELPFIEEIFKGELSLPNCDVKKGKLVNCETIVKMDRIQKGTNRFNCSRVVDQLSFINDSNINDPNDNILRSSVNDNLSYSDDDYFVKEPLKKYKRKKSKFFLNHECETSDSSEASCSEEENVKVDTGVYFKSRLFRDQDETTEAKESLNRKNKQKSTKCHERADKSFKKWKSEGKGKPHLSKYKQFTSIKGNFSVSQQVNTAPLHPSWAAKQREKTQASFGLDSFQGKKIIFD